MGLRIGPQFVSPPEFPRVKFFVSLDLGQSNDSAALGVLQRTVSAGDTCPVLFARPELVHFDLRHLQRFPLGTRYPDIVAGVADLLDSLALRFVGVGVELVFDNTGVGRAVGDLLRVLPVFRRVRGPGDGFCRLLPVNVHGGDAVTHRAASDIVGVPKRDLIAAAVVLFQCGRLRIAERIPERETLVRELVNFRRRVSAAGGDSYGNDGKLAKHDDCVTVVALSAWAAQRDRRPGGYVGGSLPLPNSF
jgi:hypothetical protein